MMKKFADAIQPTAVRAGKTKLKDRNSPEWLAARQVRARYGLPWRSIWNISGSFVKLQESPNGR
jgi:hypothetical protein